MTETRGSKVRIGNNVWVNSCELELDMFRKALRGVAIDKNIDRVDVIEIPREFDKKSI